jgi:hypothetical protein
MHSHRYTDKNPYMDPYTAREGSPVHPSEKGRRHGNEQTD